MGSKLSSLLVQEGLVPVKKLEGALAMQAILGGQLDTILLEKGIVDEATLIAAVARATGLPPAVAGILASPSPLGAELIDAETAHKLGVCPVAVDSRNLSLLVSETSDPFALEDLAFRLDRTIHPYATIELRLLQAWSVVYGEELDSRFARLLQSHPVPPAEIEEPTAAPNASLIRPTAPPEAGEDEPDAKEEAVTILEPLDRSAEGATAPDAGQVAPERTEDVQEAPPPGERPPDETALPKVMIHPDLAGAMEPPAAPSGLDGMPPIPDDAEESEEPGELEQLEVLPERELIPEEEPELEPPPTPADADEDDEDEDAEEDTDPGRGSAGAESWDESTDPGGPPVPEPIEPPRVIVEVAAEPSDPTPDEFAEDTDPDMKPGIRELGEEPLALTTEMVLEAQPPPPLHRGESSVSRDRLPTIEERPVAAEKPTDEPEEKPADEPKEMPADEQTEQPEEAPVVKERAAEPVPPTPLQPPPPVEERLEGLIKEVREAESRDALLIAVARGVLLHVDGVKLYVVKGRSLVGHLELDADGAATDAIREQPPLSLDIPTVLARAVESGALFLGTAPDTDASVSVLAAAGIVRPRGLVLMPVVIRTKTVCLVLGWTEKSSIPSGSRAPLARLTQEAALGMAELIVRLKRGPSKPGKEQPTQDAKHDTDEVPAVAKSPWEGDRTDRVETPWEGEKTDRHVVSDIGPPPEAEEPPDLITLLHQLDRGDEAAAEAERAIHRMGKDAVQALISWFPGRVTGSRLDQDLPPVAECSAVLRALVLIGRPVLSSIAPLLLHPDAEVRFYATYLISELVYPEAVALLARQLSDPDPVIRRLAVKVLRQFRQMPKFPQVVADLRTDLTNPDPRPRRGAVEALGALGDEEVVGTLVTLLQDRDPTIAQAARSALISITKQDHMGNIPEWESWWEANRNRTRIEWLIDGLGHDDPAIRASSAVEIEELTGKSFGYSYDMPRRERDAIRRRFLEWWSLQK